MGHPEYEEHKDLREKEGSQGRRERWDLQVPQACKDHPDLLVNVESEESRDQSDHEDPQDWVVEWETRDLQVTQELRVYLGPLELKDPLVNLDLWDPPETVGRGGLLGHLGL